jgi:hypothetical protein
MRLRRAHVLLMTDEGDGKTDLSGATIYDVE